MVGLSFHSNRRRSPRKSGLTIPRRLRGSAGSNDDQRAPSIRGTFCVPNPGIATSGTIEIAGLRQAFAIGAQIQGIQLQEFLHDRFVALFHLRVSAKEQNLGLI